MQECLTSFLAGMQVRAAATLGGNLVLTRDLGLESDAATLLIAAGAEVQTATPGSKLSWQTVESYVSGPSNTGQGEVVVAIRLPPIKAGDRFWSFKVGGTVTDQRVQHVLLVCRPLWGSLCLHLHVHLLLP